MPEGVLKVVFASHEASLGGGAERALLDVIKGRFGEDGRVEPTVSVPGDGAFAAALRAESISASCRYPLRGGPPHRFV